MDRDEDMDGGWHGYEDGDRNEGSRDGNEDGTGNGNKGRSGHGNGVENGDENREGGREERELEYSPHHNRSIEDVNEGVTLAGNQQRRQSRHLPPKRPLYTIRGISFQG